MKKEQIIDSLREKMRNQAIDLEWVQEKILEELSKDLDKCSNNCVGLSNPKDIDFAAML